MEAGIVAVPAKEFTKARKARHAVNEFKALPDTPAIRGVCLLSALQENGMATKRCPRNLSSEFYGSMDDARIVELKGLNASSPTARRHNRIIFEKVIGGC